MQQEMTILEDGSEKVPYYSPTFPIHASFCRLSAYPARTCVCHWHEDLEFILVRRGRMRYQVNGERFVLTSGQGVVVLPRQIHGITAVEQEDDASFLCVVFRPGLLDGFAQTQAAAKAALAETARAAWLLLDAGRAEDAPLLGALQGLADALTTAGETLPLHLLAAACLLVSGTGTRLLACSAQAPADRGLPQLRQMIGYIQTRYAGHLSLTEVAQAGAMSRSACTLLFRRLLGLTPMSYVNDYRLERAMTLLQDTSLSMTEIALSCGFCSASYFAELFTRRTGMAPSAFRHAAERARGDKR